MGLWSCQICSLSVSFVEVSWCSGVVLNWPTGFVGSRDSWEGLWCRSKSAAAYTHPRVPGMSYKVICDGCHLWWALRCLGEAKLGTIAGCH